MPQRYGAHQGFGNPHIPHFGNGDPCNASSRSWDPCITSTGPGKPRNAQFGSGNRRNTHFGPLNQRNAPRFGALNQPNQFFGDADECSLPFGPVNQYSAPFSGMNQPNAPFGNVNQPNAPFGNVNQPNAPFGNVNQPNGPFGNVNQPNGSFGNVNQPNGPFGNVNQPNGPFGNVNQPNGPFGNVNQPNAPFGPTQPNVYFGPNQPNAPFGHNQPNSPFGPNQPNSPFGPNQPIAPFGHNQPNSPFGPNQSNSPFGPNQSNSPFGPNQPIAPFGCNQPNAPFGGVNQLNPPFDAMNQPMPVGTVNHPNVPFGNMNQLDAPFEPVNHPNAHFGPVNQSNLPYGVMHQPNLPDGAMNQPNLPDDTMNQPNTPFSTLNQPSGPFGTGIQPNASFGVVNHPSAPFDTVNQSAVSFGDPYNTFGAPGSSNPDFGTSNPHGMFNQDPYANVVGSCDTPGHAPPDSVPQQAKECVSDVPETVEEEVEIPLPEKLTRLFKKQKCDLCICAMPSEYHAEVHFKGKQHMKKIKRYLQLWSKHEKKKIPACWQKWMNPKQPEQTKVQDECNTERCTVCQVSFLNPFRARHHYESEEHERSVEATRKVKSELVTTPTLESDVCHITVSCADNLEDHMNGSRHQKQLKRLQEMTDTATRKDEVDDGDNIKPSQNSDAVQHQIGKHITNLFCKLCNVKLSCEEEVTPHLVSQGHLNAVNVHVKQENPVADNIKCDLCKANFSSQSLYDSHLKGKTHIEHESKQKTAERKHQSCELCRMDFFSANSYKAHFSTPLHIGNEQWAKEWQEKRKKSVPSLKNQPTNVTDIREEQNEPKDAAKPVESVKPANSVCDKNKIEECESDENKSKESESDRNKRKESESDRNKRKESESDRNKRKESESDRNKRKESESDRNKRKESESDRNKRKECESDRNKKKESERDKNKSNVSDSGKYTRTITKCDKYKSEVSKDDKYESKVSKYDKFESRVSKYDKSDSKMSKHDKYKSKVSKCDKKNTEDSTYDKNKSEVSGRDVSRDYKHSDETTKLLDSSKQSEHKEVGDEFELRQNRSDRKHAEFQKEPFQSSETNVFDIQASINYSSRASKGEIENDQVQTSLNTKERCKPAADEKVTQDQQVADVKSSLDPSSTSEDARRSLGRQQKPTSAAEISSGLSEVYHCCVCNLSLKTYNQYESHMNSLKHKKILAELKEAKKKKPRDSDSSKNGKKGILKNSSEVFDVCEKYHTLADDVADKCDINQTVQSDLQAENIDGRSDPESGECTPTGIAIQEEANDTEVFECKLCEVSVVGSVRYEIHLGCVKHVLKMAQQERLTDDVDKPCNEQKVPMVKGEDINPPEKLFCEVCNYTSKTSYQHESHIKSNDHKRAIASLEITRQKSKVKPVKQAATRVLKQKNLKQNIEIFGKNEDPCVSHYPNTNASEKHDQNVERIQKNGFENPALYESSVVSIVPHICETDRSTDQMNQNIVTHHHKDSEMERIPLDIQNGGPYGDRTAFDIFKKVESSSVNSNIPNRLSIVGHNERPGNADLYDGIEINVSEVSYRPVSLPEKPHIIESSHGKTLHDDKVSPAEKSQNTMVFTGMGSIVPEIQQNIDVPYDQKHLLISHTAEVSDILKNTHTERRPLNRDIFQNIKNLLPGSTLNTEMNNDLEMPFHEKLEKIPDRTQSTEVPDIMKKALQKLKAAATSQSAMERKKETSSISNAAKETDLVKCQANEVMNAFRNTPEILHVTGSTIPAKGHETEMSEAIRKAFERLHNNSMSHPKKRSHVEVSSNFVVPGDLDHPFPEKCKKTEVLLSIDKPLTERHQATETIEKTIPDTHKTDQMLDIQKVPPEMHKNNETSPVVKMKLLEKDETVEVSRKENSVHKRHHSNEVHCSIAKTPPGRHQNKEGPHIIEKPHTEMSHSKRKKLTESSQNVNEVCVADKSYSEKHQRTSMSHAIDKTHPERLEVAKVAHCTGRDTPPRPQNIELIHTKEKILPEKPLDTIISHVTDKHVVSKQNSATEKLSDETHNSTDAEKQFRESNKNTQTCVEKTFPKKHNIEVSDGIGRDVHAGLQSTEISDPLKKILMESLLTTKMSEEMRKALTEKLKKTELIELMATAPPEISHNNDVSFGEQIFLPENPKNAETLHFIGNKFCGRPQNIQKSLARTHENAEHLSRPGNSSGKKFACKVCQVHCSAPLEFQAHTRTREHVTNVALLRRFILHFRNLSSAMQEYDYDDESEESPSYMCIKCGISSLSVRDFNRHLLDAHWSNVLLKHKRRRMEQSRNFSISKPSTSFDIMGDEESTEATLIHEKHIRMRYGCVLCNENFSLENDYKDHLRSDLHKKRIILFGHENDSLQSQSISKSSKVCSIRNSESALGKNESVLDDIDMAFQDAKSPLRDVKSPFQDSEPSFQDREIMFKDSEPSFLGREVAFQDIDMALQDSDSFFQDIDLALGDNELIFQDRQEVLKDSELSDSKCHPIQNQKEQGMMEPHSSGNQVVQDVGSHSSGNQVVQDMGSHSSGNQMGQDVGPHSSGNQVEQGMKPDSSRNEMGQNVRPHTSINEKRQEIGLHSNGNQKEQCLGVKRKRGKVVQSWSRQ